MIIKCDNCNKSFDIDTSLIPEKGRLLQCNSCDHKWFFLLVFIEELVPIAKIKDKAIEPTVYKKDVRREEMETPKTMDLLERVTENTPIIENISIQDNNKTDEIVKYDKERNIKKSKNKKSYNILGITIVFIISFIAIIIVLDTFQKPISVIVPNIEFILYNLYETINDILLFISDLI